MHWSYAARGRTMSGMTYRLLLALVLTGCFDNHGTTSDAGDPLDDAGAPTDAATDAAIDAAIATDAGLVRCEPEVAGEMLGEGCFCNGPLAVLGDVLYRRAIGVEVYDLAVPTAPVLVRTVGERPSSAGTLLVDRARRLLYSVSDVDPGARIYDLSAPLDPVLAGELTLSGYVIEGALDDRTLVMAATDGEASVLHVVDTTDPASPLLARTLPLAARPSHLAFQAGVAAVVLDGGTSSELIMIDVESGETLASMPLEGGGFGRAVALDGELLYLTGGDRTLTVLRRAGSELRVIGALGGVTTYGRGISLAGTLALLGGDRLRVVDLADPTAPRLLGEATAPLGDVNQTAWRDPTLAYVSNGNGFVPVALHCD